MSSSTPSQSETGKSQRATSSSTSASTASKWGSFFQGAVAGLESRLDTILAEDGGTAASAGAKADRGREDAVGSGKGLGSAPASASVSRSGSLKIDQKEMQRGSSKSRHANDRLQQRLAKAVAKGTEDGNLGRASGSQQASRSASPATTDPEDESQKITRDAVMFEGQVDTTTKTVLSGKSGDDVAAYVDGTGKSGRAFDNIGILNSTSPSSTLLASEPTSTRDSVELPMEASQEDKVAEIPANLSVSYDAEEVDRIRKAYEEDSKARQEEIHAHMERIDALQAKLLYLTKSAAETAQRAAAKAPAGTLEKKLAQKEEQLALLMEEGQKLSKSEMKHLSTIKRLQAKVSEDEKAAAGLKKKFLNAEKTAAHAAINARRAQETEKHMAEKTKRLERLDQELQRLKDELDMSNSTVESLRKQLTEANKRLDAAGKKALTSAMDSERKTMTDLRDELADLRIEKKLVEDRAKSEVRDIKAEHKRQQDRASFLENELRNEISNLEHKLEVFRSRTEEVSSSSTADSQAKLLRQLERLQSQYALASENWQGIEGTLTAKATALERERDELTKREIDLRKRARETTFRSQRLEEELENAKEKSNTLEGDLLEERSQKRKQQDNLADVENTFAACERQLKQLQTSIEATVEQRVAEEKAKWQSKYNSIQIDANSLRPASPTASFRKQLGSDMFGASKRNASIARLNEFRPSTMDQSLGRGPGSATRSPGTVTPTSLDPYNTFSPVNGASHVGSVAPRSPSGAPIDPDDSFDTTLSQPRTAADMISTGITGAGPSVQLVERMSAAVRKLETEKAAAKEEYARIVAQRDEARTEVVALMGEAEQRSEAEVKIKKLEEELDKMNKRYQTTLEMLGEKSERVDELMNDVADLKQIYRELVEAKTT